MKINRPAAAMTMLAGGVLWSGYASAQPTAPTPGAAVDMFTRDRNISVQERRRPEYEASGARVGAFTVSPKVEWTVESNDNIYATPTNETSDYVARARPEIAIDSNWAVNSVGAYARGSINRYSEHSSENTNEYSVGVNARADATRLSNVSAGGDYSRMYEPRTSPNSPSAAVKPIELKLASAFISGAYTSGRLKLSGRADVRQYNYSDGSTSTGAVIDQDRRDRDVTSVLGRVDVAINPDTALFVSASSNERRYDLAGTVADPARDSRGTEYLFGANFELTTVVRGEIAVGYIEQNFDAAIYSDTSQFSGRAKIEWFPTQLTTVTFAAGRTVEDAVNPGAGGFTSSSSALTVDHELLRNVILSGRVRYSDDDYVGIDRNDHRFDAHLGATYLINRNVGIAATLSTIRNTSDGADRHNDFTVNRLAVSLVTQF